MSFYNAPFQPIRNSTAPSFNTSSTSASSRALESTGIREWQFPTNRSVRLASVAGDDFYVEFGSSGSSGLTTGSSEGMLVLGNTVEIFRIQPGQTHIAWFSTTDVIINVTLGTGAP